MKKVLLITALLLSVVAYGQQRELKTKNYEPWIWLTGGGSYGAKVYFDNGTYQYYYDEDDRIVKHGKQKGGGTKSVERPGGTFKYTYDEDMNYVDGKLDGIIKINYRANLSIGRDWTTIVVNVNGNYKKGKPDGKWVMSSTVGAAIGSATKNWTYVYSNGKIMEYTYSMKATNGEKEKVYYKTDGSGAYDYSDDKLNIKKGILTNIYMDKQGAERLVEEEQKMLINSAINEMTKNDSIDRDMMLDKGYVLRYRMSMTCYGNGIREEDQGPFYVIPWHRFDEGFLWGGDIKDDYYKIEFKYRQLAKVYVATWEDVKKECDRAINYIDNVADAKRYTANMYEEDYIQAEGVKYLYLKWELKKRASDYVIKQAQIKENKKIEQIKSSLNNSFKLVPFSSAKNNQLVGYSVKEVDLGNGNISYDLDYRNKTNGGYSTISATFKFKRVGSSYEFKNIEEDWQNSKRKNNLYDSIVALEKLMFEAMANDNLPDISKTYNKECLVKKISAVTMDEYKKKLLDQAKLIKYCMNFAKVRITIAANGDTLTSKAAECKRGKDILGMYNAYLKTVSIAWNPKENVDEAIKRLNDLVAAQEVYMRAMEQHKTIEAKDAELMAKAATCKNVVKAYSTYFKTADNNWKERTTATELKKALDEIDATQSEFEEAVGSYATLAENNAAIMEKAKVCKNIVKAYSNYISDMEKSFAVTTNPAELNRDISVCIEAQDYIKEAVNSGNAAEFDKKVKAQKDKSIDSVLQAIK